MDCNVPIGARCHVSQRPSYGHHFSSYPFICFFPYYCFAASHSLVTLKAIWTATLIALKAVTINDYTYILTLTVCPRIL